MEAWTDERLDDLAASLRPLPMQVARVTEAVDRLTEETHGLRQDMYGLRQDMSASQRQIAQIGWALAIALFSAMIALTVAVL